ncbi:unnamed protein product [Spirodela intermedia]|uniref:DUF7787 domain-containing protein n=1 Tax=Spirodela intermedia TaxID=51605 RepID=A0A7I8L8F9_SPIIN|nr:unnamed protein product [Spirodela intermedia]
MVKRVSGSGKKKKKLCLEDYIHFCNNPDRHDFLREQLDEIIYLHGFARSTNTKVEMARAVAGIELMQAARSTVHECITPSNPLTVEEVRRDLEYIGWQECPLKSVKKVEPAKDALEDSMAVACSATANYSADSAVTAPFQAKKSRKRAPPSPPSAKKVRKRNSKEALPTLSLASTSFEV